MIGRLYRRLGSTNRPDRRLISTNHLIGAMATRSDKTTVKHWLERIKAMGQVLSRDLLYDCKAITEHLRAMLLLADEEIRSLKK